MSEQAMLEVPTKEVDHSPASKASPGASGPDATPPQQSSAAMRPEVIVPASVATDTRRGRWFIVLFAALAMLGAAIALAAPGLRPIVAASADSLLGEGNFISRLVSPAGSLDVRAMAAQAMNGQLADYSTRLDRLAAAQQAMSADLGRALVNMRADHATGEALSRSVDDLSRQTQDLRATTVALDRRVRAAGFLTLALRLRRDLDAGLPIEANLTAIAAAGPYPPSVEQALGQLHAYQNGAPTMRDLADELDRLMARLTTASDAEGSWTSRAWTRVERFFGGAQSPNAVLVRRLHALAIDGRFTEAASEIMASNAADEGMAWAARVRARATAVVATQSLLAYSLAEYENAFAATGVQ
jgi:hypothetical protein